MRAARLMLMGVVVMAACSDLEPTSPITPQLAKAAVGVSNEAAVAHAVPEFGGWFVDDAGRPTVYVTDMAQADRVRDAIAPQVAAQGFSPNQIVALPANFPYAVLQQAFDRASHAALPLAGTVFTDLDESVNRVVVGVENPGLVRAMERTLANAGLEAGSYEVIVTEPIHQLATLRQAHTPIVGGLQIHFTQYVCTIGTNVTAGGQASFITNSHCTATQGGVENTAYYQPSSSIDPTVIAYEVADPVYVKGGSCPRGKKCRYSDSSRARYTGARASSLGVIALTSGANNGSLERTGSINVTGTGNVAVGTTVNKVGRTTGWTRGNVTRTCVNTGVQGSQVLQMCQHWVSGNATIVGSGDSGSSVWTGSGSAQIVGLLWGGSSDGRTFIFSPIAQVVQELGPMTFN